jgi:type I restriction enzyme S subunit
LAQTLTHTILKGVRIKFEPEKAKQIRIGSILKTYDDLIENNRRRIQLLEQSARLLYKEWFVRLRFPGHERVKIKDGVPEGWGNFSLAELSDSISYGYTASANIDSVGPKFLRITDIVPEVIDWAAVPFCKISEKDFQKFSLQEGDIVVARTGATVGYAKRIGQTEHDAVFASYLVRFRFNEKIDNTIAGIFMESQDYKTFVRNNAGGAAQPNANAGVLSAARLLVPPKSVQKNFREIVEPVNQQKDSLQKLNRGLMKARDFLLPRLMNGEIIEV